MSRGVALAESWLLTLIYAVSAYGKFLQSSHQRVGDVQGYRILPIKWSKPVAIAVPVLEAILALGLNTKQTRKGSAIASTLLMLVFSGAIASAVLRGLTNDCGCFGALKASRVSLKVAVRDLVLAAVSTHIAIKAD